MLFCLTLFNIRNFFIFVLMALERELTDVTRRYFFLLFISNINCKYKMDFFYRCH